MPSFVEAWGTCRLLNLCYRFQGEPSSGFQDGAYADPLAAPLHLAIGCGAKRVSVSGRREIVPTNRCYRLRGYSLAPKTRLRECRSNSYPLRATRTSRGAWLVKPTGGLSVGRPMRHRRCNGGLG